jgi:RNA polymerase sigma factor (sigma-70 family)
LPSDNLHNESLLVQEMQAGSEEAFTTLYRHYSPKIFMNVLAMVRDAATAEEIVQELFTRIWQKRRSKGLKEHFAGYMFRIAQNLVHDFFRRLKRDRRLREKFEALAGEKYENIDEPLLQQQSSVILRNAIEHLSPRQKKVYELVKLEGLTYKKTAEQMGISPLTVKEYLVAANKSVKEYLIKNMGNSFVVLFLLSTCCRD